MNRSSRRRLLAAGVSAVAVAALTACGSSGSSGSSAGSSGSKTVTIVDAAPFGDPALGQSAAATYSGAELGIKYVNSHGGVDGGQKLVLAKSSTGSSNDTTVNAFRGFVTGGSVHFVIGPVITPQVEAVGPVIKGSTVMDINGSTTTALRGTNRPSNLGDQFSIGADDLENANGLAYEIGKNYKNANQVDVFSFDYQEGRDAWASLKQKLAGAGLNFTSPVQEFVPLTAPSFTSQVSAMLSKTPAAGSNKRILALLTYGGADLTFLQEAAADGLLSHYSAILTTDEYYLEAEGIKGTAPTVWNAYDISDWQMFKNPIMTWFYNQLTAAKEGCPNDWSTQGFDSVLWYAAAINKAKSTDEPKVLAALNGLTAPTAVGTSTFNTKAGMALTPIGVSETVGDPSAACGVKLIGGGAVPTSVTLAGWNGLANS